MANYVHETTTERYLRGLAARAGIGPDSRVLNIACEHELVPSFLRDTVDPNNVYGVDIDDDVVDGKRVLRCNVDTASLPFAAGSFDAVVSVWGLEHFATDRVVRESARVLTAGGVLLFATPNVVSPLFALKQVLGAPFSRWYYRFVLRSPYEPHATHYRLNSARAMRRAADGSMRVEQLSYVGPAHALYYANFSRSLQRAMTWLDRTLLTNRLLGRFKPYLAGTLVKAA